MSAYKIQRCLKYTTDIIYKPYKSGLSECSWQQLFENSNIIGWLSHRWKAGLTTIQQNLPESEIRSGTDRWVRLPHSRPTGDRTRRTAARQTGPWPKPEPERVPTRLSSEDWTSDSKQQLVVAVINQRFPWLKFRFILVQVKSKRLTLLRLSEWRAYGVGGFVLWSLHAFGGGA